LFGCSANYLSNYKVNFNTWNDIKWQNIIRQHYDYSCIAAATSTLMNFYFKDRISEYIIISLLIENLETNELKDRIQHGFTLLDLKKVVEKMGYSVSIVKMNSDAIFTLRGPVLIPLKIDLWEHFVVLKGIRDGYAFLADPSRGNIRISLNSFFSQWDGTVVVLGKPNFGLPRRYPLALPDSLKDKWPEKHSIRVIGSIFHPQL
jgi:predicted double-glycine peptidase